MNGGFSTACPVFFDRDSCCQNRELVSVPPEEKESVAAATKADFVERLLEGPEDEELKAKDLAWLESYLKQPVSLATIHRERRTTGRSETQDRRDKLKLICDYNRKLQELRASPVCSSELATAPSTHSGAETPAVSPDQLEATGNGRTPPDANAELETESPFAVNEGLSQIRIDGITHDVPQEAARMAKLLLGSKGGWVSMRNHDFTKPSETRKALPVSVFELIETAKGKGYRLKPRR